MYPVSLVLSIRLVWIVTYRFLLLELTKAKFLFAWGQEGKQIFMYISINVKLASYSNISTLNLQILETKMQHSLPINYWQFSLFYSKLQNNQLLIFGFLSKVFRNTDTSKGMKEKKKTLQFTQLPSEWVKLRHWLMVHTRVSRYRREEVVPLTKGNQSSHKQEIKPQQSCWLCLNTSTSLYSKSIH